MSLRDVKIIPGLNGPDQKLKWSTIKQEYQHLKNLDLRDTDTGPVQLIIGTNSSDLILPKQILKTFRSSGTWQGTLCCWRPHLGWAVTNWLPGERRVASPYNGFKVYERSSVEDEELKQLVMAQSEIETLGVVKLADPTRSIEDKRALSLIGERQPLRVPVKMHMCQVYCGEKRYHLCPTIMKWQRGGYSP